MESIVYSAMHRLSVPVRAFIRVWETLQVELHGQYSLGRLEELHVFLRQTSLLRVVGIALATPLSCVVTIIVLDVLPLRPTTGGIANQSAAYWVRSFSSMAVLTSNVILQFFYSSSRLRITRRQLAISTLLVSTGTTLVLAGLHFSIGFPTPFLYQTGALPWQALMFSSLWVMWGSTIREDIEARRDLLQYLWLFTSEFSMLLVYPVLIFVFGTLSGVQQTIFSFGRVQNRSPPGQVL